MSSDAQKQYLSRMHAYATEQGQVHREDGKITTALYMKCIHNLLSLVTGGSLNLYSFQAVATAKPLGRRERRYFTRREQLPPDLCPHNLQKRSCILDEETRKTRLEISRGSMGRPRNVIHLRLDRGAGCWTAMHALFSHLGFGLEGTYMFDEPHKVWDDCRNAIQRSGLSRLLVALLMLCNISSGPWGGAAFFRELQEATARYTTSAQADDPMLFFFYEFLQWEAGESQQEFGSKASLERMIAKVASAETLHLKGDRVKLHRWFSLLDRVEQILPHWFSTAMMICLMVLERGNANSMLELQNLAVGHLQTPMTNEEEGVAEESGSVNLRKMKAMVC